MSCGLTPGWWIGVWALRGVVSLEESQSWSWEARQGRAEGAGVRMASKIRERPAGS